MSKIKKTRDENLDEIVFAHRNKEYGAYELRKSYKKNVIKSLSFAFFLLLITTVTPLIMAFNNQSGNNIINETYTTEFIDVDNHTDVLPPPPPPPPTPVTDEQQVKYTAPEIVENAEDTIEMSTNDDLAEKKNDDLIPDEPNDKKDEFIDDEPVNFYVIEEKPEFPGGIEAINKWIVDNVKYPGIAKENGVTGKVFVQFVIDKEGKVTDVQILRGVDPYLDKEAMRVVSDMPSWTPGKQRGKAVKVSFQLPINFKLY
ncbi:MAG: hypothetical protein A2X08_02440 [Bacteroidetes bacterium GWA2_32_17]|nr:MAG: hypothetical protein A2X08_02440 [Bacteroidetes bacterium GWA2_32_17]